MLNPARSVGWRVTGFPAWAQTVVATVKATQAADRDVAERWADEAVDQEPVAGAGGVLDLMAGQPIIEQVAQRDIRPRGRIVPHLGT